MKRTHGIFWAERLFKLRRLCLLRASAVKRPHQGGGLSFTFEVSECKALGGDSHANDELLEDADMGAIALSKPLNASWWEWNSAGSVLFFW